jgi:hypothetical protein
MATAVTDVEIAPVSNLTFYRPSRDGRWKPVTIHTILHTVLPPITLEGGYDKVRTPTISGIRLYPPVLDPALTQPRPTIGQQGGKADVAQDSRSFHRLVPYVTMVSGDGRPFLGHVTTTTSIGIDKTSRLPWRPSLLSPYKRAGQGSTRGTDEARRKQEAKRK